MPLLAIMSLCITSCGDDDAATETESGDTTAATTPTPDTVATAATPSHMMIVRHRVKDFARFKSSYDSHDSLRKAHGLHSFLVGRGVEDPNMVLVAVRVDDVEKAKAF